MTDKHPCDIGEDDLDHDWKIIQDSDGDGLFTRTFHYKRCCQCGEEKACEDDDLYYGDDFD